MSDFGLPQCNSIVLLKGENYVTVIESLGWRNGSHVQHSPANPQPPPHMSTPFGDIVQRAAIANPKQGSIRMSVVSISLHPFDTEGWPQIRPEIELLPTLLTAWPGEGRAAGEKVLLHVWGEWRGRIPHTQPIWVPSDPHETDPKSLLGSLTPKHCKTTSFISSHT